MESYLFWPSWILPAYKQAILYKNCEAPGFESCKQNIKRHSKKPERTGKTTNAPHTNPARRI